MLVMRPATAADGSAVRTMISARCDWMEEREFLSWRESIDDLVSQCDNPYRDVWVLELDGSRLAGRTTLQKQGPPRGWTEAEKAESALYMTTSVTDPAFRQMKPGTLIALWAVDQAAQRGVAWVRRDCQSPELAKCYQSQGYQLVREVRRGRHRLFMMARAAEPIDLAEDFAMASTGIQMLARMAWSSR